LASALGPDFYFATFHTHPDPYSIKRALDEYWVSIQSNVLPLFTLALALFSGFKWNPRSRVLWLFVLIASITAWSSGKLGSETNHFLELAAAVSLLAALSLEYLLESHNLLARPLTAAVLLLAAIFSFLPSRFLREETQVMQCESVYQMVKNLPGQKILSEDVAALVLASKPVLASNPFVITQLGDRVEWSHGSLEEMVKRREFDLILLGGQTQNFEPGSGRWSPALIRGVAENYKLRSLFSCPPNLGAAYAPTN
jgi:hypothetical protein